MKAGPLRAAVAFVLVHLRAVAVLVCALRRLVRVIIAYLLVLLLLFNADWVKTEMRSQQLRNRSSQLSQVRHRDLGPQLWGRHLQSLRRGLRGTAVTLVSGSITEGSVHLLLEDVWQGMQRDAAQRGWVIARVGTV